MELILAIALGLGLSAACGFRVFVPFFALSAASHLGWTSPGEGFAWLATTPALVMLGVASFTESVAYYVPWLDNALDTLATPAAVIAGVIATACALTEADPLLQWTTAVIGGAGIAGTVQTGSVLTRAASTLTTGGLGNFLVSTLELVGALLMTLLVMVLPLIAGMAAIMGTAVLLGLLINQFRRRKPKSQPLETPLAVP